MTDLVDDAELADEEEPGRVMASYMGRITLRDPRDWDVSRANRPIEPNEQTVKAIEEAIDKALTELGFAVKVALTRTDK